MARARSRAPALLAAVLGALALGVPAAGARLNAQMPGLSAPPARALRVDPTRLRPGQFVYETVLEHDITSSALGTRTMTATQATYNGSSAWLLVETKTGGTIGELDSLFLDAAAFRPLHWSSTIDRAHLGIEFRSDSAFGGTNAPAGRRSVFSAVPPGVLINAAMLEMALRTLPLQTAWEDSASTLSVTLNGLTPLPARLAVIGEDNVRVPAGQFDCWVVSVRAADVTRGMYWVTKRDPMVVRSALDVPGLNGAQYVSSLVSFTP